MPTPYLAPTLKDQGFTGATGTTPYKPASANQVDTLKGLYNNSPAMNAPQVVSATATVININFDGTQNNGQFPAPGEAPTNVFELSRLQREAGNPNNTIYLPGVGAQTVPRGTLDANGNPAAGSSPSNWDSIPSNAGSLANGIVERAYQQLSTRITTILADNPNAEISLNLSGFSRGGAQAVAFANYVNERGIPGLYEAGQVPIDSMVLFDPVSQTSGQLNTAWPSNVKNSLVMVAENEGRAIMPAMPVGGDATVVLVPGAHADVGGSFNPDGVAAVTLKMARDFQEKSGVPVAEIPDSLAPNWEQMNVHNSGLDNYGNTMWSFNENYRGYEGAGFRSPSVQDVIRNGVPYGPSSENTAAGDVIDYKVPADPTPTPTPEAQEINDALLDAFSKADQAAADLKAQYPGVQVADAGGGLPQTSTHASTNTNSFSNFLNTQGSSLTPAQQETLAAQVNSLGLGGEADLSFYSLPGGGALIANADGDIVGEINHSDAGDLNLRATAIDAEGNAVQVSQHISESGQSLTDAQYSQQQLGQLSAGLGLVNNFQALQNWGDLNDLSRLSTLVGTYNNLSNLSGGASGFLGDLGPLAGGLSLLAALDSGDGLGIVSSSLQLGQMGLNAYSGYMSELALQMMNDMMVQSTVDAATSAAFDAAAKAALESAATSSAIGQTLPYISVITSLANFEDNPAQSIGSLVGMCFCQAANDDHVRKIA